MPCLRGGRGRRRRRSSKAHPNTTGRSRNRHTDTHACMDARGLWGLGAPCGSRACTARELMRARPAAPATPPAMLLWQRSASGSQSVPPSPTRHPGRNLISGARPATHTPTHHFCVADLEARGGGVVPRRLLRYRMVGPVAGGAAEAHGVCKVVDGEGGGGGAVHLEGPGGGAWAWRRVGRGEGAGQAWSPQPSPAPRQAGRHQQVRRLLDGEGGGGGRA